MAVSWGLLNAQPNHHSPIIEPSQWAKNEFGKALLGNRRRSDRLIKIASSRAAQPSRSLPQCLESKAQLKAAYHVYDNPGLNREAILKSHYWATAERLSQEHLVLAVSDQG
jgi:hypothetical protein